MELLRRAIGLLNSRKEEFAHEFKPRQETSSSTSSSSASPASKSDVAKATDTPATSSTSSKAATSAAASGTISSSAGLETVTDFVSTPAFTATKTTAYEAHGVNGTSVKQSGSFTGTSTYTASAYLATANASAPGIPDNELTACHINGTLANNGPFCSPIHGQNLWVGYTYAITWNPALFPKNATLAVVLRYAGDAYGDVWDLSGVPSQKGYANINMDKTWLMGAPGNDSSSGQNATFLLYSGPTNMTTGPMISLVVDPSTLPRELIHNLPEKYGLEIGLPIGIVAALLVVLAIVCGMRKHNRHWKDVKSTGKDYMARRQRKRGRTDGGGIQLEEMSRPRDQDAFSDEPYIGGSGNAFRDEVARQREEDDRYRGRITSY